MKKIFVILIILGFVACDDILEVKNISNTAVVILAPTNNVTLNTAAVNFTWEPVEEAESYHVQIATPNFEAAQQIVKDTILTSTNVLLTLENGEFQWRVRGENSAYQTKYTITNFTIEE